MGIRKLTTIGLVAAMAVSGAACGDDDDSAAGSEGNGGGADLGSVRLLIDFFPVGLHAPTYVAQENGYFEDEGLSVSIRHVTDIGSAKSLVANQGDIGYSPLTTAADVSQESDVKLKAVYSYQQTSPMAVLSTPEGDITTPADVSGKELVDFAGSATQLLFPLFLEENNLSEGEVEVQLVDPATRLRLVVQGRTDGSLGFWPDNEPQLADQCKCTPNVVRFDDNGVHHLGNGFIVREDYLDKNGEAIEAFLRAITRGLEFTRDDPQGAADIFAEAAGEDFFGGPEVALGQVENQLEMVQSPAAEEEGLPLGAMAEADWQATVDVMVASGQIEPVDDLSTLYTNDLVSDE